MADCRHLPAIPAYIDRLELQSGAQPLRDKTNIVAPTRFKLRVHIAGTTTDAVVYNPYKAKVMKAQDLVHSLDPFVADHGGYPFVTPATPYALQSIGPMWSSDDLTLSPTAYALRQRTAKAVTADSSSTVKDLERAGSSSPSSWPGFCPYGGYASLNFSDPFRSPTIPLSVRNGNSNASSVDAPQQGGAPQASNISTSSGFFTHQGYNQSNTRNTSLVDAPQQGGAPQASSAREGSPTSATPLATSSGSSSDDEFGYSFQLVRLGRNGRVLPLYHEPEGLESPPSAQIQRVTKATTRVVLDDSPQQGGAPQASSPSTSSSFFAHRGYNKSNTRNASSVDAPQQGGAPQASNLSTSSSLFARRGYNQSSTREDSSIFAAPFARSSESSSDEFGYSFQLVHLGGNGQVSPLYHEPEGLDSPPSAQVQRVTKATTRMPLDDSPSLVSPKQTMPSSASHIPRALMCKAVLGLPAGIPKRVVSCKAIPRMSLEESTISKANRDSSQAKKKPLGLNRFMFEPRFSVSPRDTKALPRVQLQRRNATRIAFGRGTTDVKQKKTADIPSRRATKDAGLGINARPTGAKCISVKSAATVPSAKDNSDKISLVTHVADPSSLNLSEEIKSVVRVETHTLDRIKEPPSFRSDVTSASRASSRASRLPRPSTGGSVKQKVSLGPVKKDLREELADVKRTLNEQRGMISDLYNRLRTSNEGPKTNEKALLAENKRLVAENSALKKANAEMKISAIRQRGELQRAQVDNVALKNTKARLSFQLQDIEDALSQQVRDSAMELELLKGEAAHWKAKVYSLTRMVREAFADDAGSLQSV